MLQQMMVDDKEVEVRESVVRSLGILFGFISDSDKYTQVQNQWIFESSCALICYISKNMPRTEICGFTGNLIYRVVNIKKGPFLIHVKDFEYFRTCILQKCHQSVSVL